MNRPAGREGREGLSVRQDFLVPPYNLIVYPANFPALG